MIKISNPRGWEGGLSALTRFEPELRSMLGQTALVWLTTGGLAVIRRPYQKKKKIGLLLQLIIDQNLVELKMKKISQGNFDPDFSDIVLQASEKIVQRLLNNHCS